MMETENLKLRCLLNIIFIKQHSTLNTRQMSILKQEKTIVELLQEASRNRTEIIRTSTEKRNVKFLEEKKEKAMNDTIQVIQFPSNAFRVGNGYK